MEEIELHRSGKRPIVFIGEEVEYLTDKEQGSNRWTVARVFRLQDGGYVVGIAKKTNYLNERDVYDMKKFKSLQKAVDYIGQQEPGLFELMTLEEKIGPNSRLDTSKEKGKIEHEKTKPSN